jgi:hypothetical protein
MVYTSADQEGEPRTLPQVYVNPKEEDHARYLSIWLSSNLLISYM